MTNAVLAFILSLLIGVVYGVIFTQVYPLVKIDSGLALGFAIAGLLTYAAARSLLRLFKARSAPANDEGASPKSAKSPLDSSLVE
jgi:uncharacterized membrane protein YagU involved in acid resistance